MTDLGLMNVRNLPNCFFKDLTRPLLLQKRGRGWFVKTSRYTVRLAIGGGIIPQTTPHLLCKRRGRVRSLKKQFGRLRTFIFFFCVSVVLHKQLVDYQRDEIMCHFALQNDTYQVAKQVVLQCKTTHFAKQNDWY